MIGYKVVRKINSKAYGPATRDALQRIRYRINQTTKQNGCGAFCLFERYEQAVDFVKANSCRLRILKVEYEPAVAGITAEDIRDLTGFYPDEVENEYFVWKWTRMGKGYGIDTRVKFPAGTVFASSITPIEEVLYD